MIQMSKEAQEIKVKELFRKDHIFFVFKRGNKCQYVHHITVLL